MKRTIVFFVTLTIAIAANAFGQAKVGTTGGEFLTLPYSLRALAMGEIATVFADRQAYAGNPGSIGLIAARPEISIGPLMWSNLPASIDYLGGGGVLPVTSANPGKSTSLGVAAYTTSLTSGSAIETTYQIVPTGTVHKWSDHAYHLLAGLGIDGPLQLGLGAGFTYFRESVGTDTSNSSDYTANGWCVDFGLVARAPIALHRSPASSEATVTLTPSAGIALTNLGPSLDFIANDYPLARLLRAGCGGELAITTQRYFNGWRILSAATAIEYEKQRDRDGFAKVGAELGLGEALYFRIGHEGDDIGSDTWGFALGSSGLARAAVWAFGSPEQRSGLLDFLVSRLSIEYAQSYVKPDNFPDEVYRGFTLTYRYGGL